ncbi:MAG: class I SAM-dependent methyltransferase [Flavobacteriales bacterium]
MIEKIKSAYKFISGRYQTIHLEYKTDVRPRYGYGKPPHPMLYDTINSNRQLYGDLLREILTLKDLVLQIDVVDEANREQPIPHWNNGFLPGLDILGIIGMFHHYKPQRYVEVGSGNSTKVARWAANQLGLKVEITSIDPFPRADITDISDVVIRKPLEDVDMTQILKGLSPNDILFIDNSHRSLPNSDVTVTFLDVFPNVPKGVVIHIHDIYLPYDYPQFMCDRFYNEQYLLAVLLMGNREQYSTILPNFFISEDPELSLILNEIWNQDKMKDVERHGGSFWLQKNK